MLISISLSVLKDAEVIGRDRIRLGPGIEFRIADWDRKNRCLVLEPTTIPAMPADGIPSDSGSALDA
jgi:hypothetical protein